MRLPALAALAILSARIALAADSTGGDLQRFVVQPVPHGGFASGGGELLDPGSFALGLHLNHARNPLVVRRNGVRIASTVEDSFTTQLHAAVGLLERFEIGLVAPLVGYQAGNQVGRTLPSQALGDLRILPRIQWLTQWRDGLAVTFVPGFSIPVGNAQAYSGDDSVVLLPELAASWRDDVAALAGSLAARIRPASRLDGGAVLGSELNVRVSYGYQIGRVLEAIAELNGGLAFQSIARGTTGNPLEFLVGGRLRLEDAWALDLAAGGGLFSAPGTPDLRIVAGVTWGKGLPYPPINACLRETPSGQTRLRAADLDTDADGLDDACDACPTEIETKNGYLDADGCPDAVPVVIVDADGDGVLDPDDLCPAVPGVAPQGCPDRDGDGVSDDSDKCVDVGGPAPTGCPDRDGDGVFDAEDQCPEIPGDPVTGCPDLDGDGVRDSDDACPADPGAPPSGCPDLDGDGLTDAVDTCPDAPEDKDNFQDADGCPDLDDDSDGVPDTADKCPNDPEDKDAFQDEDGCPDPDNDSDGIADAQDKCPTDPETINGVQDDDGCPDKGNSLVVVRAGKIDILDRVFFKTNSDVIEKKSYPLLDQVALTIKAHGEIHRIRVEGHTDDVGGREKNLRLSQKRAEAVVKYLVGKSIEPDRLYARGFAFDRPIVPNVGEKNRAQNRRVEFTILGEGDAP